MRREDRPQYPAEALREAVVNALCHRDYSDPGASIGVSIYDDRLEVWSWGRLPNELTPEKLRGDHPSIRRNDLIAEVFYRRGYVEKWGSGTQKILEACRHLGLQEPEFIERAGEVGVRFWAATTRTRTKAGETDLTRRQQEVLSALAVLGEGRMEEIRQRLQTPPSERMIQKTIASLIESGRISRTGKGRSTRYRLGKEGHRRSG
jgi:ATP-dependent DNA helicase RecG